MVQASNKNTEKRLKWYGHVRRMKEEHIVRRMLELDIPGKRRRGRPNLRWKDACKRDMTQAGLKEDNATNRAEWRKKLISYTRQPQMTGQARDEGEDLRMKIKEFSLSLTWRCVRRRSAMSLWSSSCCLCTSTTSCCSRCLSATSSLYRDFATDASVCCCSSFSRTTL